MDDWQYIRSGKPKEIFNLVFSQKDNDIITRPDIYKKYDSKRGGHYYRIIKKLVDMNYFQYIEVNKIVRSKKGKLYPRAEPNALITTSKPFLDYIDSKTPKPKKEKIDPRFSKEMRIGMKKLQQARKKMLKKVNIRPDWPYPEISIINFILEFKDSRDLILKEDNAIDGFKSLIMYWNQNFHSDILNHPDWFINDSTFNYFRNKPKTKETIDKFIKNYDAYRYPNEEKGYHPRYEDLFNTISLWFFIFSNEEYNKAKIDEKKEIIDKALRLRKFFFQVFASKFNPALSVTLSRYKEA